MGFEIEDDIENEDDIEITLSTEDEETDDFFEDTPKKKKKKEPNIKKLASDIPEVEATAVKEDKIITSEYQDYKPNEEEVEGANDLANQLGAFLKKECKIEAREVLSTIPTGIDLFDAYAGGGVCTGLSQMVGPTGAGKSAFACKLISTGQRKWPGKFLGTYIDSEHAMTKDRLAQLGVRYPRMVPYQINTVEGIFSAIEGICAFKEQNKELLEFPSIVVWDSIANTLTEKGLQTDDHNSVLGQKAALLTHLLPKYSDKMQRYNISLFGVNQLRDKIEIGYGNSVPDVRMIPDKNIPGGKSLGYNTIQMIYARQTSWLRAKKSAPWDYGFPGCRVMFYFAKNKLFTPNVQFELIFSFENGFSNFWTNYELLKKAKVISAAGGSVKLANYSNKDKFPQKKTLHMYKTNDSFREAFDEAVEEVITKSIINKYKTGHEDDDPMTIIKRGDVLDESK